VHGFRMDRKYSKDCIDSNMYRYSYRHMTPGLLKARRRITANLPERLLDEATKSTGQGITETIIRGLELVKRSGAFEKAERLKGKVEIKLNLDVSRERPRR